MKNVVVRTLLRLYPADWRREYGPELMDMLLARPLTAKVIGDVFFSGLRQRKPDIVREGTMTKIGSIGLAGFSIILANNLRLLVLREPVAHVAWWSTWFPWYAVWLVLVAVGFGRQLARR